MAYDTSIPGAGTYGQAILQANNAYQNALARRNSERTSTLQQYGFQGSIDPNSGTLTNMHVDPNARYGQFQQMLRGAAQAGDSMRDQLVARQLGKGGLAAQGEDQLKSDFGQNSLNLSNSLTSTLGQIQDAQNQDAYTRDQAVWQAQHDAATAAAAAQQFNPATDPTAPPAPGPASSDQRVAAAPANSAPLDAWAVNAILKSANAASKAKKAKPKITTKGRQL